MMYIPTRLRMRYVYLIVKVRREKNKEYWSFGVAKSGVDDDGEVKVMFYKAIESSLKRFKCKRLQKTTS